MSTTLQPVQEETVGQLMDLMQAYYLYEELDFSPAAARRAAINLVTEERLGRIWFILSDNKIVGYLALAFGFSLEFGGRDAFVDEFFILEGYRGQGIGKSALGLVEPLLKESQILALHLEVDRQNAKAKQFYLSQGFENRERFHLMSKRL